VTVWKAAPGSSTWLHRVDGSIPAREPRQFATFADLCNACGNCDVFCPEDGGPFQVKPRFFGTLAAWQEAAPEDGFYVGQHDGGSWILGRFDGREYLVHVGLERVLYSGDGFALTFEEADPLGTLDGEADGEVDLGLYFVMNLLRGSVLDAAGVNFVNSAT
jgi:putative selenate reductase